MNKPLVVVIGFIGKLPLAGMALYNIHYISGLQALGYDVHYLERQNITDACYDPDLDAMTDDASYALAYLDRMLLQFGITRERYSFVDRSGTCFGSGWSKLKESLRRAEFVLSICEPAWFDELELCRRRVFVDGDPLFTQAAMMNGESGFLEHFDTLFTYATRIGKPDCTVPAANRQWIATKPVVATKLWNPTFGGDGKPFTTVMHWGAGSDVCYDGRAYGHKAREFEKFITLPQQTAEPFVIAIGGNAPRERILSHGWRLVDPLATTRTIESYQDFIRSSRADIGIAKHAYVASRCGWFSDRSTCYLAAGRPVLHQDTGCGDWLPTGEGVMLFSDVGDILESIKAIEMDYARHAGIARTIAEEYFEASTVVAKMVKDACLN